MFAFTKTFAARTLAAAALIGSLTGSALADPYQRWVDIENVGSSEIMYVYISHIGTGQWGPDLLGSGYIDIGDTVRVDPVIQDGYCRYDVMLVFDDGSENRIWDVNLCEAYQITANESSEQVYFI